MRSGAFPVRPGRGDDDDRSPSPLPCFSRGRMQTASAAVSSGAMTRSASRAASRGCLPQAAVYARPNADNIKIAAAAAAHYQPLDAKYPDLSGHQVFLVDRAIRPLISLRRVLFVPAPETKVSNATKAVGMLVAVGAASGSAAGRQVSNRVLELVSRGGEVLREVVQAVVKAVSSS